MPTIYIKKKTYYMDYRKQVDFKIWLVKNKLTTQRFAIRARASVEYINLVIDGKVPVTQNVRDVFERGGYILP